MAKYDFNNSRYVSFWKSQDGKNALSVLLTNPELIKMNYGFWRTQFKVDPLTGERQPDGTATFAAKMRKAAVPGMLDLRSPLGDSYPRDKNGVEFYLGTIPDFIAKGYVEQAMEREAKRRMFDEYFGNDAEIVMAYRDDLQVMIDEGNQTMTNMSRQLLSRGNIVWNYGDGIKAPLSKATIPATNYKKAGAKAWSDPECKLIDQMQKIEADFRDESGYQGPLKWQIPLDMFRNVFLKNTQVIEYIKEWRELNEKVNLTSMTITTAMFEEAFKNNEFLSPIEVVKEQQKDGETTVHGWDQKNAVLRPTGFAGQVKKVAPLDIVMAKKYGAKSIVKVFSNVDIFTFFNTTLDNGDYQEWHTDMVVSAVPTLDEFLYHVIVDTSVAG